MGFMLKDLKDHLLFENLLGSLSQSQFDDEIEVRAKFQYRGSGLGSRSIEIIIKTSKKRKTDNKIWSLKNEHFFFLFTVPNMNPSMVGKN